MFFLKLAKQKAKNCSMLIKEFSKNDKIDYADTLTNFSWDLKNNLFNMGSIRQFEAYPKMLLFSMLLKKLMAQRH